MVVRRRPRDDGLHHTPDLDSIKVEIFGARLVDLDLQLGLAGHQGGAHEVHAGNGFEPRLEPLRSRLQSGEVGSGKLDFELLAGIAEQAGACRHEELEAR